ncbi:hypothetical protein BCV72DRAFT_125331 [Rhizopus microsporus var. microsporus]|uniref:BUB1 N-terminal domain-containing protein n=1 Tax=Rhizopus microsporus var. microsporus TaxID=86635 RepID=A0A1X0R3A0_RHIZD|nr:hypothetical protein BCV72DRAFT_125331 [Rhizopus microsporus var. microsporus]
MLDGLCMMYIHYQKVCGSIGLMIQRKKLRPKKGNRSYDVFTKKPKEIISVRLHYVMNNFLIHMLLLAIDIWKSYTEFIMEKFYKSFETMDKEDEELIETTREDLLKAVSATTFHVKRSQEIWRLYAQFETDVMNKFKKPEQIARVKKIYLDRLDVLHIDCEETFNAYSTYITAWDNANYESNMVEANKIYAATKVAADERDVFEQKLVTDGYALDTFYEYIENEKAAKNKFSLNNIRCLYERAILIYCTDPGLWNDYIMFLIEKARVQSFLEHICRRSVRNCPWSGALWAHLARLIETRGGEPKEINEIFDKALSFQPLLASVEDLVAVLLAKCDYYRRRIDWDDLDDNAVMDLRVAFEESLAYVDEAFPKSGDPYYRIEKFYARISARLGDADKARELWESVVVRRGRDTEAWIQYINFERNLGNYHKCESLFKKAIVKRIDNPTRLIDVWNEMEHEFGTLTTHEDALVRIHQKTKALASEWQAQYAGQEQRRQTKEMKEQEHKRKKGLHRTHQKQKQKEKQASFKKVEGQKELLGIEEDNDQVQTEASSSLKRKASTEDIDQETVKRTKIQPQGSSRGRAPRPARRGKSIALGPSRMSRDHKPAQETEPPATVTAEPKSNDDFRAMLLGKK